MSPTEIRWPVTQIVDIASFLRVSLPIQDTLSLWRWLDSVRDFCLGDFRLPSLIQKFCLLLHSLL